MADSTYESNKDFSYKCEHAKNRILKIEFDKLDSVIQFGHQNYKKLLA